MQVEYEWGDEGARAAELLAMRVRPAWGKRFASAWGFAKHIWWVLHEPALHKDRRVRSRATKFVNRHRLLRWGPKASEITYLGMTWDR